MITVSNLSFRNYIEIIFCLPDFRQYIPNQYGVIYCPEGGLRIVSAELRAQWPNSVPFLIGIRTAVPANERMIENDLGNCRSQTFHIRSLHFPY